MIFGENSGNFETELMHQGLNFRTMGRAVTPKYKIKHMVAGTSDMGWPARRNRYYSFALHEDTLVWLGPPGEDITHDFLRWFGRACAVEGDIFTGLDSEAAHEKLIIEMANKRGFYPDERQLSQLKSEWKPLLCRQQGDTFDAASEIYTEGTRTGHGGSFILDLSQSRDRLRTGPWLPTVARSTLLCSLSRNKFFTAGEVDFAMGWPSFRMSQNQMYYDELDISAMFGGQSARQSRLLAGNGMMLPQLLAFYLYCFCHCVRRDKLQRLQMPLGAASVREEDDGEV